MKPYFQIPQHEKSKSLLSILGNYFPNSSYKKENNVEIYTWTDIDVLYNNVMLFFDKYELKSRKFIDYKLWIIVLKLHKLGYFYLKEGRELTVEISNCINKKRYSTNEIMAVFPSEEKLKKLFDQEAPFKYYIETNHEEKAKKFAREKGSRQGFKVYVYDEKKELIIGSPFGSYSAAQKILNLSNRIVFRYIDTGKYFNNKYLFRSTPLE
jgi:hypothetical protein